MADLALPAKPEIERATLGSIVIDGSLFPAAREVISRETFTTDRHAALWDALEAIYQRGGGIDRVTAFHELQSRRPGLWSLSDLAALDDELPMSPAIGGYLDTLADVATRRKAILQMADLARALADGSNPAALATAARVARELEATGGAGGGLQDVSGLVESNGGLERMMRPHEMEPATPTPWMALCNRFEGFSPGKLTVLAARPGQGKSTMALQMATHAAAIGCGVALFSLEMGGRELLHRAACIEAQVPLQRFLKGFATTEQETRIARALGRLATLPLLIDDANVATVGGIRRALRRAKQDVGLLVVDYLQLMSGTAKNRMRHEEISEVTRGLKILARETGVHILALSQITRNSEHEKRQPELRDLRESGSIEQDADNCIFIHHLMDGENLGANRLCKVLIRKQRTGPVGNCTLAWNHALACFEDVQATTSHGGDESL